VGVRAAVRVAVHERVRRRVVGVVPRRAGDPVPPAVGVDAGDRRVVHPAGHFHPLAGRDGWSHAGGVVVVRERVHRVVGRLLLAVVGRWRWRARRRRWWRGRRGRSRGRSGGGRGTRRAGRARWRADRGGGGRRGAGRPDG